MASHTSESEGEIIESDYEKATTARPSVNGTSVNRSSRLDIAATSRRSITPYDRDRSRSPFRHDKASKRRSVTPYDRERSRSPYRRGKSPRGEKRRRDDEPTERDPRRFKVRYEDRPPRGGDHRARVSYADIDRTEPNGASRYDDRNGRDHHRGRRHRTRSRSRSPYRASRERNSNRADRDNRDNTKGHRDRYDGRYNGDKRRDRSQSVSDQSDARKRGQHAETGRNAQQQDINMSDAHSQANSAPSSSAEAAKHDNQPEEPPAPVDEAALIEERRKRREAIKAKYKGQATPMLVQALHLGADSQPATPQNDATPTTPRTERSMSPMVTSPRTPKDGSAPGSPATFAVTNDEELANRAPRPENGEEADGPSAADYDPTEDMREDRKRGGMQEEQDVSAATFDENHNDDRKVLLPDEPMPSTEKDEESKSTKGEFDMFAEDEDDDMFAPSPAKKSEHGHNVAVAVPKAKELDQSLLDNWDDPDGYYKIILGELIDGRYHVQANLGKGMFSGVVRAMDTKMDKLVAIKIIRNNETMKKAGLKEIEILDLLKAADPEDKKHVIRLERHFEHKGHLCMVFENLSINLREVLKKFGRDVGINLKAVRSYAQQMFLGLGLLRKCNILHADLKPDNVLVNDTRNILKICDLGSAADASENEITPYLVSRFYRAPEIILGMPYDFAIDTWSIGCTLFELYTGKILFTGRTNNQMLKSIMECRGKFSLKMLKKAEYAGLHFDDNVNFRSVEKDKITGRDVVRMINFIKPTRDLKSRLTGSTKGLTDVEVKELNLFVDLLDRCLHLNPEKRITPAEALKHPFISRRA